MAQQAPAQLEPQPAAPQSDAQPQFDINAFMAQQAPAQLEPQPAAPQSDAQPQFDINAFMAQQAPAQLEQQPAVPARQQPVFVDQSSSPASVSLGEFGAEEPALAAPLSPVMRETPAAVQPIFESETTQPEVAALTAPTAENIFAAQQPPAAIEPQPTSEGEQTSLLFSNEYLENTDGMSVEAHSLACDAEFKTKFGESKSIIKNVSFRVPKGSCCAFGSPRFYDSYALLQIIGGCNVFTAGELVISGEKIGANEQVEMPNILYLDDTGVLDCDLSVESFLDLSFANMKQEVAGRGEELAELLQLLVNGAQATTKVSLLTAAQKLLLLMITALFSKIVDTVIINIPEMSYSESDRAAAKRIFAAMREHGKTVLMATMCEGLVADCANIAVALSDGQTLFNGHIEDFCCKYSSDLILARTLQGEQIRARLAEYLPQLSCTVARDGIAIYNRENADVSARALEALLRESGLTGSDIIERPKTFVKALSEAVSK